MGEIGGNQESKELVWTGRGRCVRTTEPSLNARKESVAKLLIKIFFVNYIILEAILLVNI